MLLLYVAVAGEALRIVGSIVGYQVGVLPFVLHVATVVRCRRLCFAFLPQHVPMAGTVSDPAISLP
jgi:hypothetical protein